ncbi:t29.2 [Tupaiid betaherpesvirus 1]|uniref:T29.2 n=1 Tax=Tupaiid herpesvirus 1 (strain 1) TaxID=10397 RepID=Q91TR5_TUHV1|nr:t29.2 [Tupaiid betaherpesvirus 1]AAK57072.1 t29.2 [Tupaiid betaherpesvirus 1]
MIVQPDGHGSSSVCPECSRAHRANAPAPARRQEFNHSHTFSRSSWPSRPRGRLEPPSTSSSLGRAPTPSSLDRAPAAPSLDRPPTASSLDRAPAAAAADVGRRRRPRDRRSMKREPRQTERSPSGRSPRPSAFYNHRPTAPPTRTRTTRTDSRAKRQRPRTTTNDPSAGVTAFIATIVPPPIRGPSSEIEIQQGHQLPHVGLERRDVLLVQQRLVFVAAPGTAFDVLAAFVARQLRRVRGGLGTRARRAFRRVLRIRRGPEQGLRELDGLQTENPVHLSGVLFHLDEDLRVVHGAGGRSDGRACLDERTATRAAAAIDDGVESAARRRARQHLRDDEVDDDDDDDDEVDDDDDAATEEDDE